MDAKGINYARVGIFVLLGLATAALLVFIIGDERHMFNRKATLHTQFRDVAGLRAGSLVRMGGVDVGAVTAVRFGTDPSDTQLHVDFEIVDTSLTRVRRNSVARVVSKGLLGDKALEVTIGDMRQPQVADGAAVPSEESDEISDALHNAATLLNRANTVMDNVVAATRPLANPQLGENLVALSRDLRTISHQVAEGDGTLARLLHDPQMANNIAQTLAAAQAAARDVQGATAQVNALARDARTGRGLIHALVYDEQGARAVQSLSAAANEFAAITRDVRTGTGGLHSLIYGQDSAQAVANLNQATATARDILRDVQRGRGTLGALLVDPSLYEDLKGLVGNVQRNEILRAMARYSIHANERDRQQPPAVRPEGAAPPR